MKKAQNPSILLALAVLAVGILYFALRPAQQDIRSQPPFAKIADRLKPSSSLTNIVRILGTTSKEDRPSVISKGVRVARERKEALEILAKTQPARALNAMMSLDELASLPPEIRSESEIPFNAIGSIDLRWATSVNPDGSLSCTHKNLAIVEGKSWEIASESFADPRQPLTNVPLNGYVVGDVLVLNESGVRELSAAEIDVSETFFPNVNKNATDPVTGRKADPSVAAVIGGQTYHFENPASLDHVRETIQNAELATDASKNREVSHGLTWLPVAADSGSSGGQTILASPFINDSLKVLFIRADFADFTGAPVTKNDLQNSLSTVNTRVQNFSYSKASITSTVTNNVYRLPTNGATVATAPGSLGGIDTIISEAKSAASADFTLANFDVIAVFFPNLSNVPGSKITFGGLASVGGGNHWINGVPLQFQVEIILHEFGHNYGLNHANYQHPAKLIAGDYLDHAQTSLEYGDIYDRMGEGDANSGYFSPYATSRLEWMPTSKVITPNAGGTFRIHRFDSPAATTNTTLALKVSMGGSRFHWVGLRQLFQDTAGKAFIVNEGIVPNTPNLIDATPNSTTAGALDRIDAALPVGSNFYDAAAGVRFTTMASGGTEPNQFIDVKIDFDSRLELQSTNILVDEAAGNAALVVTRGFSTLGACSVSYSTDAGTATSGTDFHATSGTLTWADGDSTARTIYVPIRPDTIAEGSETFSLTLSSPTNAVIAPGRNVAAITILDAGIRVTQFAPPSFDLEVNSILPLDDGKILAGGKITKTITGNIVRFNADGSEDTSFLKGTGFGGALSNRVSSISRQTDGKLLVGGEFFSYNGTSCAMVSRLNADGTVDSSFCTALGTGANNRVHTVAVEADGKILIGGDFTSFNGTSAPGIIRLNSSGTRDTTTPISVPFGHFQSAIYKILVQNDGKIMIAGSFALTQKGTTPNEFRSGIARLNQNGTLDSGFDPGFGAHLNVTNSLSPVFSIARQSDGKYLVGGLFTGFDGTFGTGNLVRIDSLGDRDTTFAPPLITSTFSPGVGDIKIHQNGRILVSGAFGTPAGKILGLLSTGSIDPSFNLNGGANFTVSTIATNKQGEIFFGGGFLTYGGEIAVRIVKVAGGLDPFTLWKSGVFTPTQIAAGLTGPEEDFDNDGILNITEMALGLSPTVPNSPNSFAIAADNLSIQSVNSSQFLQATMQRSADNIGVWLVAQFSSDLTSWLPATPLPGSNATYDVTESSSTRFTVRDKTPSAPGVKRFVRFRAVLPN